MVAGGLAGNSGDGPEAAKAAKTGDLNPACASRAGISIPSTRDKIIIRSISLAGPRREEVRVQAWQIARQPAASWRTRVLQETRHPEDAISRRSLMWCFPISIAKSWWRRRTQWGN